MNGRWVPGNHFTLLENGEEFFPRVFECIAAAEREVLLETFILFEDKVGKALQQALLTAARRGVQIGRVPLVDVTLAYFGMEHPVVGGYAPHKVALRRAIGLAFDVDELIARLPGGTPPRIET